MQKKRPIRRRGFEGVVLASALLLAALAGRAHAIVPEVTETEKYTTPFAGEELGVRLSAQGRRCAAQIASGNTRYMGWSSPAGWISSSVSSTTDHSVAAGRTATIISSTTVGVTPWPDGDTSPAEAAVEYVHLMNSTNVALDGDRIAIVREASGFVDTYVRDGTGTWNPEHQFSGTAADGFGASMDLAGDVLVIGSPKTSVGGPGYIDVWTALDTPSPSKMNLPSPDPENGNTFGAAVAVAEGWIAVGAPLEDTSFPQPVGSEVGAVYLFERSGFTWSHQATLFGDTSGDEFGTSLDLGRVTLVVGAPLADEAGPMVDAGEVYVYRRDPSGLWGIAVRLRASDASTGDRFGHSVALSLPGVLVGAPEASGFSGEQDAGGVYHFEGQGDSIFIGDFESGFTTRWSSTVSSPPPS